MTSLEAVETTETPPSAGVPCVDAVENALVQRVQSPGSAPAQRPTCAACMRPRKACICGWVRPAANLVAVLILQHPLEVHQAKGTGRLLHLSLVRSQLLTGETFAASTQPGQYDLLLYPETAHGAEQGCGTSPPLSAGLLQHALAEPAATRLIVLDGTWRKSRQMLLMNPWLQTLPRLPLANLPRSAYLNRKAHKPDQRSTLEATCAALALLENDAQKYQPLLDAFDGFVAQQMAWRTCTGR